MTICAQTSTLTYHTPKDGWDGAGQTLNSEAFGRYEGMMYSFAQMVNGKMGYKVDLETEARVHRCLLASGGIKCDYKGKINL